MDILSSLNQFSDWGFLFLRVALGAVFLAHGTQKFAMWKMQPSSQMPSGTLSIMRVLSIAETFGGTAMVLGFLTQFAAIGLGIIMFGAIWKKLFEWKKKFTEPGGWELDFVLLAAASLLAFFGPGLFSLDRIFFAP